mmetsp:Transcript_11489/g.29893  ORF Transcript_11489/g.29893 Transcript_11489/m.29893 type:complete len:307 (+) Transcript_11489:44-964(+)
MATGSALERVLQRHESSRGVGEAHEAGVEEDELPGELPEPAPAHAPEDAKTDDTESMSRPGTARRLAAAERSSAGELEERAEELRESLERVRYGFDTALSGLREWREQRASEDADTRARLSRELDSSPEGLPACDVSTAASSATISALQAEVQASAAARAERLLAADGVLRACNSAKHIAPLRASCAAPHAASAARAHAVVSARVEVDSSTPDGFDALDGEDRALQQALERELLKKYGLLTEEKGLPDRLPASTAAEGGAPPAASGNSIRDLSRLKLELSKYNAGVEYVLSELGGDSSEPALAVPR